MTELASTATKEEVVKAIADQVIAGMTEDQRFEEAFKPRIVAEFKKLLDDLKDDDPLIRKFRGYAGGEPKLIASKFSRHNMNQSNIEFLFDLMTSARKITGVGPSDELAKAFKDVSDGFYIPDEEIRRIDKTALDDVWPRVPRPEVKARFGSMRAYRQARNAAYAAADDYAVSAPDPFALGSRAATMDTGQSGFGQQLTGVQYVGDLWDAAFQDAAVAPLFPTFEMTAPQAQLPVVVDMPEPMFLAESTSDILATAQYTTVRTGSNRVTVNAKKIGFHQVYSGEMEEDSIIPWVPFLQRQLARALAFYTDALVLLGDTVTAGTGNINSDDAAPTPGTKWYLAFDGIKKAALIDNTANAKDVAAALALSTFRDVKNLMRDTSRFVDWGLNPARLIWVAEPQTAQAAALLDEVVSAKLMAGQSAGLLNGQIASIMGSPVISHMALSLTDTDGKFTTTSPATNDAKGQIIAFNPDGGTIGWRRRIKLQTEAIAASDQYRICAYMRLGFGRYTPTGAASGQEWAAIGYDISV